MIIDQKILIAQPCTLQMLKVIIKEDITFFQSKYPEFQLWFEEKVLPGLLVAERSIIVETRNSQIAGFAILKHNHEESKICTLRVRDDYANTGIGIRLFEKSFDLLETSSPLLSVSDEMYPKFNKIFRYFGFSHEETYHELYRPKVAELSFNGALV